MSWSVTVTTAFADLPDQSELAVGCDPTPGKPVYCGVDCARATP